MTISIFYPFFLSILFWYFFATLLQWHAYQFSRVFFKFHKRSWLIIFFIVPYSAFVLSSLFFPSLNHIVVAYSLISIYFWRNSLDKKLVFTGRIKRFFAIFIATSAVLTFFYELNIFAPILSIVIAHFVSVISEKRLAIEYEKKARAKLKSSNNLKVIAITASYGKTSIKNFLAQILSTNFKVYATPRSVNTRVGIIKDINEDLPNEIEVYIVEAGARVKGDILEIAQLVEPSIAVIGKVGPAHIEYFKTIENIMETKCELLKSPRLEKAFVYDNVKVQNDKAVKFGFDEGIKITNVSSTLDGTEFDLEIDTKVEHFEAGVIGSFNAINIAAAILVAHELGMDTDAIKKAVKELKPIEHRLQRIDAGGKVILDDSFNGNVDGMSEAIEICRGFDGTKVIVTPGLVEASVEDNKKIATKIDEVFDLVILTGSLNIILYDEMIKKPKKIILQNKAELVNLLAKETKAGELIYFANDAPSYI